jgi:hypothetical protein
MKVSEIKHRISHLASQIKRNGDLLWHAVHKDDFARGRALLEEGEKLRHQILKTYRELDEAVSEQREKS